MTNRRRRQVRLRCFVAMRIGDRDTDAVYDRLIEPTIRRVGLTPRRIDRVMHNERIDQRILAELQAAHAVVADLTFARPSVYWEAGFAEARGIPVVYTCKGDHFKPRPDDEYGNFRVHFDLQTKNIIRWTSAADGHFRRALEGRLRYVLRPVLQEHAIAEARKREEELFAALPMDDRRRRVVDMAIREAHALGFRGELYDPEFFRDSRFMRRWFEVPLPAARLTRGRLHALDKALVVPLPRLTKSTLRGIRNRLTWGPLDKEEAEKARTRFKTVVDHGIVISFSRASSGMVDETLPRFKRDLRAPWPMWSEPVSDLGEPGTPLRSAPERIVKVHVLDNIRSEPQAREALKQVLLGIVAPARR